MANNILKVTNHPTEALRSAGEPHLKFYGGKVLKAPKFVGVYPGAYWKSEQGMAERGGLDQSLAVIPKSKYADLWKEYGAGKGRYVGSTLVESQSDFPKVSDRTVQQLIKRGLKNRSIVNSGPEGVYTVFLPKGSVLEYEGSSSKYGLGGYHGSFKGENGKPVYYSVIVYSDKENGIPFSDKSTDNITITASHEWSEVATDPDVVQGKLGWYDELYGEISDIPLSMGMPLNRVWGRVDGVAMQKNWSNRDHRVELTPKAP